jgi:hypothetical protein
VSAIVRRSGGRRSMRCRFRSDVATVVPGKAGKRRAFELGLQLL